MGDVTDLECIRERSVARRAAVPRDPGELACGRRWAQTCPHPRTLAPGNMASRKRIPDRSRIALIRSLASARKQKPGDADTEDLAGAPPVSASLETEVALEDLAKAPARARAPTIVMPLQAALGAPPDVPPPSLAAVPANASHEVEQPAHMPLPRDIPGGAPDEPAPPPGRVPPGDSRSLRKRTDQHEFALIYRQQTVVITRFGRVGTRGQWRVVEYPTSTSAAHAYARECSRFVSEGFSDYRD